MALAAATTRSRLAGVQMMSSTPGIVWGDERLAGLHTVESDDRPAVVEETHDSPIAVDELVEFDRKQSVLDLLDRLCLGLTPSLDTLVCPVHLRLDQMEEAADRELSAHTRVEDGMNALGGVVCSRRHGTHIPERRGEARRHDGAGTDAGLSDVRVQDVRLEGLELARQLLVAVGPGREDLLDELGRHEVFGDEREHHHTTDRLLRQPDHLVVLTRSFFDGLDRVP